jgi:signal transduction histidine kinase/ActR/RegA family two-component response regulator
MVIAEEPLDVALAPVRGTVVRLAALMIAGVLLAVLLSGVLARRLSKPILSLREGTERITRGDLASRIDVKTGDEIEALAQDFNAMAAQLQDYTTGLERKVEEKTAALREAMRARELFLAAASHDLRQPLYAISILGDALALKAIPEDAREVLAKQQQAIGILRSLFDNLLDLSRFEAGAVRMNPRDVSLREVLAPTAVEFEVLSHAKGLRWECDLPNVSVHVDPELLRRLVANLLSNAVRYTPSGTVSIAGAVLGSKVILTVSDTGAGIPPEEQERVFQEFVQLENPARDRDRGVGLGLSIVRKINEMLDCGLVLDSAPGKGTRVTVCIPVSGTATPAAAAAEPTFPITADFAGARIWVIEDDPLVRTALGIQLDEWSVDHDFAMDRAQILALREADGEWPAAVILDDMLGAGERGLEIARWLREHLESARIVLVTGNVEPSRVDALQESGFKVLRKPIASAVLAQALGEALRVAKSAPADAHAG